MHTHAHSNPTNQSDHGPRISSREYDRRIVALHSGRPAVTGGDKTLELRRRELDITIDYRLGQNFPPVRREALWEIQQQIDRHPLRIGMRYFLKRALRGRTLAPSAMQASHLVEEYAHVLDATELGLFFGLSSAELNALSK